MHQAVEIVVFVLEEALGAEQPGYVFQEILFAGLDVCALLEIQQLARRIAMESGVSFVIGPLVFDSVGNGPCAEFDFRKPGDGFV